MFFSVKNSFVLEIFLNWKLKFDRLYLPFVNFLRKISAIYDI